MNTIFFLLFLLPFKVSAEVYGISGQAYFDQDQKKFISGKIITIENGKIKKISDKADRGIKILNFKNSFIVPGYIDCHAHVFFTQQKGEVNFEDALIRELKLSDKFRTERAKLFLQSYLKNGFTTVCDLGNSGNFLDAKLKKQIKNSPDFPALFISGPGLVYQKGQFRKSVDLETVKKEYSVITGDTNVGSLLDSYLKNNVEILKIYLDNSPGEGFFDKEKLKEILSNKQIKKFKKISYHSIDNNEARSAD